MNTDNIVTKLKLLIALPLIVLLFVSLIMTNQFYDNFNALHQTDRDIKTIKILTDTMTQLQIERGLSSVYIESKSEKVYKKINQQRSFTDKSLADLHCIYGK